MAIKTYVLTQSYKSPYVRMTGMANNPQEIRFKKFRKGEFVKGEMKHANNQPAFVLVAGTLVLPLEVVREVTTKAIVSNVEGSDTPKVESTKVTVKPKIKLMDAVLVGAVVGFAGVYLAEKQGWIVSVDKKNKIYGAIAGAVLAVYIIYRKNSKTK
jgi:hypothetical protein